MIMQRMACLKGWLLLPGRFRPGAARCNRIYLIIRCVVIRGNYWLSVRSLFTKEVGSQAIGVGMPGVAQPTHDPGADGVEPDATRGKLSLHPAHPATEAPDVLLGNQSVRREDPVAQEADALFAREDDALVPMDLEPQGLQEMLDLPLDHVEPSLVIGKDEKV